MQNGISPDPNNKNEEYIKVEMIIHKKGIAQEDVIQFIKKIDNADSGHIDIKEIAVTGIEPVDENTEINDYMNSAVTGAHAENLQEWLSEGQDIMAQKFFEKHPMWFVITACPKCGTPNIDFPCKRCGYEA